VIYADRHITIDREGIRMPHGETEFIPMDALRGVEVIREKVGDYKQGAIGFLILGILSAWFMIGFLFLALGIAGLLVNRYNYRLEVTALSGRYLLMERPRKGPVMSLCRTIQGLILSRKVGTSR
jgi:hypothetical protein